MKLSLRFELIGSSLSLSWSLNSNLDLARPQHGPHLTRPHNLSELTVKPPAELETSNFQANLKLFYVVGDEIVSSISFENIILFIIIK